MCMRIYARSPSTYQVGAAIGSRSRHMRSINRDWQVPGNLQESVASKPRAGSSRNLVWKQLHRQPDLSLAYCIRCLWDPCHLVTNFYRPELTSELCACHALFKGCFLLRSVLSKQFPVAIVSGELQLHIWKSSNLTPPVSHRPELLEQLWKARAEKKKLRRTIKEFEDEFYQQNGR